MVKVKFCGLTRIEDAEYALDLGAHALGFVLEPSSPRCVLGNKLLEDFVLHQVPLVTTVAVWGDLSWAPVQDLFWGGCAVHQTVLGKRPIQSRRFIRVVRLQEQSDIELALLDLDNEGYTVDALHEVEFGGTGKLADWNLARSFCDQAERNVILAGGLTPDNVQDAIRIVRPYAVDVSSGVESGEPGIKDHGKMREFVKAVRGA